MLDVIVNKIYLCSVLLYFDLNTIAIQSANCFLAWIANHCNNSRPISVYGAKMSSNIGGGTHKLAAA